MIDEHGWVPGRDMPKPPAVKEPEKPMCFLSEEDRALFKELVDAHKEKKEYVVSVADASKEHALLVHLERIKAAVEVVKLCNDCDYYPGDLDMRSVAEKFLAKEFKGE